MESDAEQIAPAGGEAAARVRTRQRDASHSPARVSSVSSEARRAIQESDMDACWFLVEIAKVFWYDRHPRLRKGKPSVPQVPPP